MSGALGDSDQARVEKTQVSWLGGLGATLCAYRDALSGLSELYDMGCER